MNMKAQILTFMLLLSMFSFSQNWFDYTYDIGKLDHVEAIITDEDNNVYVCGWFEDEYNSISNSFVIKVDADGNEIWRSVSDTSSKFYSMFLLEDGSLAVCGSELQRPYLSVLNSVDGSLSWDYLESEYDGSWFGAVVELTGGDGKHLNAIKTTNGEHRPQIYIFNSHNSSIIDIVSNENNLYDPVSQYYKQAYNYMWYGGRDAVEMYSYNNTTGCFWTFGSGEIAGIDRFTPDAFAVVRNFKRDDDVHVIAPLSNNFITGHITGGDIELFHQNMQITGSGVLGFEKILVTGSIDDQQALWTINNDFELIDEIMYSSNLPRIGKDVVGTADSEIVIVGEEYAVEQGSSDIFIMKRDANGGTLAVENMSDIFIASVYPNPANSFIRIGNIPDEATSIKIIDYTGQIVCAFSAETNSFSIAELDSGMYLVVIMDNNRILSKGKFLKID